jgi:hypothetical protein
MVLRIIALAVLVGVTAATFSAMQETARGAPALAPLNQATVTPTLPPFINYGSGWGAQALPRASVNCIVRGEIPQAGVAREPVGCVSGTPVTP